MTERNIRDAAYALIATLLLMLAGAVWVAVTGWNLHGDVPMSGHGYAAMALGSSSRL